MVASHSARWTDIVDDMQARPSRAVSLILGVTYLMPISAAAAGDDAPAADKDRAAFRRYLDNATKIALTLERPEDRVQMLVETATIQIESQAKGAATPVLAQALAVAGRIKEPTVRIMALRRIAGGYAQLGDLESALDVATDSGRENIQVLQAIIDAQLKAGDLKGAIKLADRFRGDARLNALSRIARAQAQAGDLRAALKSAELVAESPLHRAGALQEIALAQAKAGRKEDARRSLAEALQLIESIVAPSGRSTSLASHAIYQAGIGDVASGLQTLKSLNLNEDDSFQGSKAYIYWRFAVEQTKAGDAHGALRLAEKLPSKGDQVSVLLQIAKTQAEQKNRAAAQATIRKAEVCFDAIQDGKQKEGLQSSFAAAHLQAGDVDRALKAAMAVDASANRVFDLCSIADAQITLKEHDRARETLKSALTTAKSLSPTDFLSPFAVRRLCESLGTIDNEADAVALIDQCHAPLLKASAWVGLALGVTNRMKEVKKAKSQ